MQKFKNKYTVKWALNPTSFLNGIVIDKKEDDNNVTPKSSNKIDDPRISKFNYFSVNKETIYKRPQENFEANEAVSYFIFNPLIYF